MDIFIGEGEKAEAATTVEAMIRAVVFMLFDDILVTMEVRGASSVTLRAYFA